MEFILRQIHKAGSFSWLYLANLFLGFHFFSVQYVHSSFLSGFLNETALGLLYTVSAGLSLLILSAAALFLTQFGNYRTALVAAVFDFFAVIGLATTQNPGLIVVFFSIHTLLIPVILFTLDVFLENNTKNEENTGNTRGIFLTVATTAALISPILAGFLAGEASLYQRVYLASALFLIPFIAILVIKFRTFTNPVYNIYLPISTLIHVLRDGNVFYIATSQFLLRFYFAWMVIYLPLYLHEHIGFTWPEIGTVLFIMLIPYILVEWPAGVIADRWLGEKELLIAGFVITALSTSALFFIHAPSILLWGSVLFVTRIGCALIESMTETYFFKLVDGDDTDMITFFRVLRPMAYTLGPLTATIILTITDIQYLWILLAAIMLIGVYHAYRLTDTK